MEPGVGEGSGGAGVGRVGRGTFEGRWRGGANRTEKGVRVGEAARKSEENRTLVSEDGDVYHWLTRIVKARVAETECGLTIGVRFMGGCRVPWPARLCPGCGEKVGAGE